MEKIDMGKIVDEIFGISFCSILLNSWLWKNMLGYYIKGGLLRVFLSRNKKKIFNILHEMLQFDNQWSTHTVALHLNVQSHSKCIVFYYHLSPVKRICVFEHSVMTNFNCACPAIQRGQGSGFLPEGSSWLTACMSEQRRFWRDCSDAQARLNLRCSHSR